MLDLYLIRHASTAPNAEKRYPLAGEDALLSNLGRRQATALRLPTGMTYSSPSARCLETAELAGCRAVQRVPELREARFGVMAGHTWAELESAHGHAPAGWIAALGDPASGGGPPGGESGADFHGRVGQWLNTLPDSGTVLAFTHLGPLLAATRLAVGLRAAEVPVCGVAHLRRSAASQGADWWLVSLLPGPPDSGPTQEAR